MTHSPPATSTAISADFLNTELSLAFTLLTCARISSIEENIVRYQQTARAVYDTVSRLLEKAKLGPWQREQILSQMAELKGWLGTVGERFESE